MAFVGMLAGTTGSPGFYRAGTIGSELGGASVRTIGCLDVGLALVERPDASLLQLDVGNRCSHPEALDFAMIRIDGVRADGERRVVALQDPRHEIVPLHVGAGERGKELVRIDSGDLVRLSFDVDAIAPDTPHAHPASMHFARTSATVPWTAVL